MEHAAYTRKRLRLEHNWMNRYTQLEGEPYNFNTAELEVIMANYPGQLGGFKEKKGGSRLFKQQ